jgi:hypothetical protein
VEVDERGEWVLKVGVGVVVLRMSLFNSGVSNVARLKIERSND